MLHACRWRIHTLAFPKASKCSCSNACFHPQVKSDATDEEIEETLNFQLEELNIMAEEELALIPQMSEWKPWDVRPPSSALACIEAGTAVSVAEQWGGVLEMC